MTERERQVRRASQTRRTQIITESFMERWREARERVYSSRSELVDELLDEEDEIEAPTAIRPLTDEDLDGP